MSYLYVLIIISVAVFTLFTVFTQIRLNRHTDAQVRFLIAAQPYNFSPLKDMAKRTLKYFLPAAALLFVLTAGAAVVYGVKDNALPDLILTAWVFAGSLAAYVLNTALIFLCAVFYVRYKIRYTPVL